MKFRLMALIAGLGLFIGLIAARPIVHSKMIPLSTTTSVDIGDIPQVPESGQIAAAQKSGDKLAPNTEDFQIALLVSHLLTRYHYTHHALDEEYSSKWFDQYLNMLDPQHLYLLKSDLAEFEQYRRKLGELVYNGGDTSPANLIFRKYIERMDQNVAFVNDLVKTEQFSFESSDSFPINRKDQPRPADLDSAKKLWRDRVRYEYLQEKLNKQKSEDIVKTLTRRYSRTAKNLHTLDRDDVFELYLTALTQVFDPHSQYMGKASLANFSIAMKLSLVGIGAQLRSIDGYATIAELLPGGPAIKSGKIKVGDRVTAVSQVGKEPVDVVDMKLDDVVDLIRGKKGTEVKLTIIPADAADTSTRKVLSLVRDEIKLEEKESKAQVIDIPSPTGKPTRVAVIDVPSFYEDSGNRDQGGKSTSEDVRKLLKKLVNEHVEGVVLDLRKNPGGSLTEAIKLSGLFLKDGPIVQIKNQNGKVEQDNDPDPGIAYGGPLIVLTSRFSASASEILAGALQDYGRAIIVGDASTHGKGSVQSLIQLAPVMEDKYKLSHDPGALKLTIQKFYRPSGSSTQLRGVVPDIILPSVTSVAELGEGSLPNAMAWDQVATSNFAKLNTIQPYFADVAAKSAARVAKDPDFAFIRAETEKLREAISKKSVSLNENQRIAEKKAAEVRVADRKKELLARKGPAEKVFNLTLKQVNTPGLVPASAGLTVQANPKAPKTADPADDGETDPLDTVNTNLDIHLKEAKNILVDIIRFGSHRAGTTAKK